MVHRCHREDNEFKLFTSKGDEIFSEEELMTTDELEAISSVPGKEVGVNLNPRSNGHTTLTSPSLTSLDMDLSIIIEEAPTNEETFVTTLEKTEGVARSTTTPLFSLNDDGPPYVPMVSETQAYDEVHPHQTWNMMTHLLDMIVVKILIVWQHMSTTI